MTLRKNAAAMTAAEQQLYVATIQQLVQNGTYGTLVSHHADMSHNMHGSMGPVGRQRFLTWHRDYLLKLEQAMQAVNPACFVPYWKWSVNRAIPAWLVGLLPTVAVPTQGTVVVTRSPHSPASLPTVAQVNNVVNTSSLSFTQFTSLLEGIHNTVHGWVGGTMNNIMISPADPVFWLHHAEIDRLWSVWQALPGNAGKNPTLSGADRTMDPWTETATKLRSITKLKYSYAP